MSRKRTKGPSSLAPRLDEGAGPAGLALDTAPAVLAWEHKTTEIGSQGLEVVRSATPAEKKAVAEMLDLVAVDSLEVSYRLKPGPGGHFTLEGRLKATLKQICIVSLEEMSTSVEEPLAAEYWPAERFPASSSASLIDDVEGEETIAIHDGVIETGRLVYDVLALAIDPYPRKAEAALEWKDDDDSARQTPPARPNPFAALAKLKKKADEQP
jgi:uncharacterized metal-binding protein YceD (DUF177 family)